MTNNNGISLLDNRTGMTNYELHRLGNIIFYITTNRLQPGPSTIQFLKKLMDKGKKLPKRFTEFIQ